MKYVEQLTERFNTQAKSKDRYANLIKRKRLERGMKLEDLATGICSVSYLSRIENSLVIPSDDNLKSLFERLDLNYDSIKVIREKNIYEELLKKELAGEKEEIVKILNEAIENKGYSMIELDLLVLYNSILNQVYDEAKSILIKLDKMIETYSNIELLFYLYLFARYLFETNQNKRAYSQIVVLCTIKIENELLKAVIYDLAIDILFVMGKETLMLNYFNLLSRSEVAYMFTKKINLHQMKMMIANVNFSTQNTVEQILGLANAIDLKDEKNEKKYRYIISIAYHQNNQNGFAIDVLKHSKHDAKILAVYGYYVMRYGNDEDKKDFIDKMKKYEFSKYDKLYENFCVYLSYRLDNESSYHLYNYLKVNILSKNMLFYDSIIHQYAMKELIELGLTTSKYKETLRYINESCN